MEIVITPEAKKQYNHLPISEQKKILKKLSTLDLNPTAGKKLSGNYAEIRSLRAWPYRILYYINRDLNKIFVVTIAHRQGIYK